MNTYRLLVPLDGSELSVISLAWATLFASGFKDLKVELLRCFELPSSIYLIPELAVSVPSGSMTLVDEELLQQSLQDYLAATASRLGIGGTSMTVAMGDPSAEILNHSQHHDLIVMTSHGRGGLGKWLLGSVATKVSRATTIPTLIVKVWESESVKKPVNLEKIVVAYDGSEPAQKALNLASDWARRFNAELHIYHGLVQVATSHASAVEVDRRELQRESLALKELGEGIEGVNVTTEVRVVTKSLEILEYAHAVEADLIAVGSHSMSGFVRWMVGSETEHVLHNAHCPVLVCH